MSTETGLIHPAVELPEGLLCGHANHHSLNSTESIALIFYISKLAERYFVSKSHFMRGEENPVSNLKRFLSA